MNFSQAPSSISKIWAVLGVIFGILFFPRDVFAWGPVAHIDFSLQILAGAAALTPAVKGLLAKHPIDFIYGSLAADSVVGKNLAGERSHCHGWHVADMLLADAEHCGDKTQSFILGYLSHLGADIVAHNHFVPERLVAHYRAKGIGHLYWEARFDQRLLKENQDVRNTWQEISLLNFPEHDQFLFDRIVPTLFSHRLSTGLYRQSLGIQRRRPWQGTLTRIDARSKLSLHIKEVARWRIVSVAMAALALNDSSSDELRRFDPTGRAAIRDAGSHRRMLRRHRRRGGSKVGSEVFVEKQRSAFGSTYPPSSYFSGQTP